MDLYHTLSYLMIGVLLQSNIGENIAAAVPIQSLRIIGIPDNVCTSLACNESAAQISSNIDVNVDPCDNFYKFACGGFMNKTIIPDNESEVSSFHAAHNEILKQLRSSFEEPTSPNETRYISVVKNFYKSCMDEAAIEKSGLGELQRILNYMGGWPVVDGEKWDETRFDWLNASVDAHSLEYPKGYFLSFGITIHMKNTTRRIFTFDEPSLGLLRDFLIEGMNNTKVQAYFKFMVEVAMLFGVPEEKAMTELEESLKFEIELAKLMLPEFEHRNLSRLYNPMTIKELSQKHPTVPWKDFIDRITAPYITVDENEIVMVAVPEFISKFIDLMKVTPKRVQANYVIWRVIKKTARFFNEAITSKLAAFEMKLDGTLKPKPRWRQCLSDVLKFLATKSIYLMKHFDNANKDEATQMVSEIKDQLEETVRSVDWFDNDTRKNALEKAAAISTFIAYPDQLLNDTLMNMVYEHMSFNNSYIANEMVFTIFYVIGEYKNYNVPFNASHWSVHAQILDVNAFYMEIANSIDIVAGILQGAFFEKNRPRYMNYGSLGTIIGHELTHAFDNSGRLLNKRGHFEDWWTSNTDEKYQQKARCIIDQYNNYTVEEVGKKMNGLNTLGENIADIGGFKISYLAYKNWVKTHGEESTLPGLKYNSQQLFWLSLSNTWCSKLRPENLEERIITDPHSPSEFRIVGTLSNLPEFAADFNCPVGSRMNPKDKCTFW